MTTTARSAHTGTQHFPYTSSTISQRTKFYLFLAFLFCLFVPGFFRIGVQLAPYRLFLIIMIIPIIKQILRDKSLKFTVVDFLILAFISWRPLTTIIHHFPSHAIFTVSLFLDLSLAYLFGRVFIRTKDDFKLFFKSIMVVLLIFLPFAIIEATTGQRIVRNIFSYILTVDSDDRRQFRYGFLRVKLGFGHAVLFGFVCMVAFSNVIFIFWRNRIKSAVFGLFIAFNTILAISSSSIIGLFVQAVLIIVHFILRAFSIQWGSIIFISIILFIVISLLSNFNYGVVVNYIIENVMFSRWSGWSRSDQIEFGLREVYSNPIIGIGQNPWGAPYWLSPALDSYWLSIAMRFGVPSAALMAIALMMHFALIATFKSECRDVYNFKIGYLISLFSVFFVLISVSVYFGTEAYLMVFIAAGAWFYNPVDDLRSRMRRMPLERRGIHAYRQGSRASSAGNAAVGISRDVRTSKGVAAPRSRELHGAKPRRLIRRLRGSANTFRRP